MKIPLILATSFAVAFSCAACSTNRSVEARNNQTLAEAGESQTASQILALNDDSASNAPPQRPVPTVESRSGSYNSEITLMTDAFGNKVEQRAFKNHPRLNYLVLRTNAAGERAVEVFGQNGERRTLPENMFDTALRASGDEIADSAGIFQVKNDVPTTPPVVVKTAPVVVEPALSEQTVAKEPINQISKSPEETLPEAAKETESKNDLATAKNP